MKIKTNRIFGFLVALSLLFLPNANGQEAITKLRVVTEMANVRLQPDIGSVIIHQVPQGTSLESTGKEGEWYLVKIQIEEGQDVSGYVHESTVIVTDRPPPVQVEPPVKKEEITEPEQKEEEPQIQPIPETPLERRPFESRLELWFMGGGNYVIGGDLNSGAQGFVDYYRDFHSIGEEFNARPLHLSYLYGGEFSI
ncbi:MAG: SH3 domain-containing protein, partial [Candidatus Aminicenantes bacterium]